mgnify:CR=1 FL=1
MTIIKISSKWQIRLDTYGNYTPFSFRVTEEGALTPSGGVSKGTKQWVTERHYFPSLGRALVYVANKELIDEGFPSIQEYVEKKEQVFKELVEQAKELNL